MILLEIFLKIIFKKLVDIIASLSLYCILPPGQWMPAETRKLLNPWQKTIIVKETMGS